MKILIIRHADPDYAIDGLTEVGKKEAELLSQKLLSENISKIYCSPLGRAKLTAKPTADKLGLEIVTEPLIREFSYAKIEPDFEHVGWEVAWDILPQFVTPKLYDPSSWHEVDFIKKSGIKTHYDAVCARFDEILKSHGYERDGLNYRVIKPNHDVIAFVCHYGVSGVLLSHIMNCSPYTIWQNCVLLPSSVTVMHTEERRRGIASLRVCAMSDTSHLYAKGESPSFAARFCECFDDDTRHD